MMFADLESPTWILALVQLAGLAAAVAARYHQGRRWQNHCHSIFLVCLGLSGAATLAAWTIGPGYCTVCGATLAVSVLTAVWEIRSTVQNYAH